MLGRNKLEGATRCESPRASQLSTCMGLLAWECPLSAFFPAGLMFPLAHFSTSYKMHACGAHEGLNHPQFPSRGHALSLSVKARRLVCPASSTALLVAVQFYFTFSCIGCTQVCFFVFDGTKDGTKFPFKRNSCASSPAFVSELLGWLARTRSGFPLRYAYYTEKINSGGSGEIVYCDNFF